MKLSFTTLDVFASAPFKGNPLAVVQVPARVSDQLSEAQKQQIAKEFNLSETVFLHEVEKGATKAVYDIFSPLSRMTFAGHPTIGSAVYVMALARERFPEVKTLETLAGDIPIEYNVSSRVASVTVPHNVHIHQKMLPHPSPQNDPSGSGSVPVVSIVKGMAFNLVPLANLAVLGSVSVGLIPLPDLYKSPHLDSFDGWNNGLHGTMYYVDTTSSVKPSDSDAGFHKVLRTRSIASREDPGTGSASSALCCYLALQMPRDLGSGPLKFHLIQGVEMGRRCDIYVNVFKTNDGNGIEKVDLQGSAVKNMEGFFEVELP